LAGIIVHARSVADPTPREKTKKLRPAAKMVACHYTQNGVRFRSVPCFCSLTVASGCFAGWQHGRRWQDTELRRAILLRDLKEAQCQLLRAELRDVKKSLYSCERKNRPAE
jgi:hypothetical protein